MYNPNEPHGALQQLATQAMLSSTSTQQQQQQRQSDVSEAPSCDYFPNQANNRRTSFAVSHGGVIEEHPASPTAAPRDHQHQYKSRLSVPPTFDPALLPPSRQHSDIKRRSQFVYRNSVASVQQQQQQQQQQPRPPVRRGGGSTASVVSSVAGAGGGGARRRSAAHSTTSTQWAGQDELDDMVWDEDIGNALNALEVKKKRFWRWFWIVVPIMVSLAFVAAGVIYLVLGSSDMVSNLQVWRLCFFIAGLPVIWWIGEGVSFLTVWVVEHSQLFKIQNALYFAYAVRHPLANVLRALLALGWWALAMTAWNEKQDAGVQDAFHVILLIWACITLFMTANLIKRLLAKMLSTKFNKESYIQKIHESLIKEYHLHMLLTPRVRDGGEQQEEEEDGMGGGKRMNGGVDGPKTTYTIHTTCGPAVHPSGGSGSGNASGGFGSSIASSMRGVTHMIFGSGKNEHAGASCSATLMHKDNDGTTGEELLSGDEGVDVEAPSPINPLSPSSRKSNGPKKSLRNIYGYVPSPPPPPPPAHPPHPPANRFSTQQRSTGNHSMTSRSTATLNSSMNASGRGALSGARTTHRMSRLAPVVEEAALIAPLDPLYSFDDMGSPLNASPSTAAAIATQKRRGLTMNQINKMEAYIRRNALQVTFYDELNATERQEVVTTESEAKKMAFYLFWNVKADLERSYLTLDDVMDFLPPLEAEQAFAMLDRNGNGAVTLTETIAAVVDIFEARCDLATSLKDTKTVIGKLESVIGVVTHFLFVFLYLLVFNVDVVKTYLALSSLILAFSFVFQNSIRTMYENVVFLFIVHPFDVGDVLQVGEGSTGETYKVDQIDLHFTIFLAGNGSRTWYPNQKLMATPFSNISASGERGDAIKVAIDIDTSAGALDAVRDACEQAAAERPNEFVADSVSMHLRDASTPMKITLLIGFRYTHNGSDGGRSAAARTMMHKALCDALAQNGIQYTNPPTKELVTMTVHEYVDGSGRSDEARGQSQQQQSSDNVPAPAPALAGSAAKKDA